MTASFKNFEIALPDIKNTVFNITDYGDHGQDAWNKAFNDNFFNI